MANPVQQPLRLEQRFQKNTHPGRVCGTSFPKCGLQLSGRFYNVGNMLYYDSAAVARQATQEVVIFRHRRSTIWPFRENVPLHKPGGKPNGQRFPSSAWRLCICAVRFITENRLFIKSLCSLQVGFDYTIAWATKDTGTAPPTGALPAGGQCHDRQLPVPGSIPECAHQTVPPVCAGAA